MGLLARKLTLAPLVAATYFMVAGGPYGLEDLLACAGTTGALIVLVVTPIVWSLPTALLVGELGSALPEEGGYYAWVKRALGPFWGFQEAWLSLAASVFDMALYPTIFTLYLARLWPALGQGNMPVLVGAAMIAACAAWNLSGARGVGGSALAMSVVLLAPFVLLVVFAFTEPRLASRPAVGATSGSLVPGMLVAMWNYMGWDNASTIAGEVDRPQRTYPIAMIAAVTLVTITYALPVVALAWRGVDTSTLTTGGWVDVAETVGGPWLARAVVVGGIVCGIGMFNALVLSYSRIPLVLAEDGYLPRFIGKRTKRAETPWVSVLLCCAAYVGCLTLGFERLIQLDVLLYGASLLLEFAALIALRVREPALPRPFAIPGGLPVALLLPVGPVILLCIALAHGGDEPAGSVSAFALAGGVLAAGLAAYAVSVAVRRRRGMMRP